MMGAMVGKEGRCRTFIGPCAHVQTTDVVYIYAKSHPMPTGLPHNVLLRNRTRANSMYNPTRQHLVQQDDECHGLFRHL